jgi:hypothetical protein
MKPPEVTLRELVLQWIEKAAADLEAAEQLCAQGGRFRGIVAFHCVDIRYPSDAPEVLAGGETKAIDIARQVRDGVMISLRPYLDAG